MGKTYEYDDEYWQPPKRRKRIDDDWEADQDWQDDEDMMPDDEEWDDDVDDL